MRILVFLSHPAQFLFFKNPIIRLREKGQEIVVVARKKDVLIDLLDEVGWAYINLLPIERAKSAFSITRSLIIRDIRILKIARKNRIELLVGSDASLAHVGRLLHIPCVTTLEDDYDVIRPLAILTYPLTNHLLVPAVCNVGRWTKKKLAYDGYMKLSYLHPNEFIPDVTKLTIPLNRPFFLIRLSRLLAYHDFGESGINEEILSRFIAKLTPLGNVFISTLKKIPERFEGNLLHIHHTDIHHYLAYTTMLICDSQSMAVEAAVLGTPSIRISSFAGRISVLEELEHKYQLTFGIKPGDKTRIFEKLDELIGLPDIDHIFKIRRQKMLADKIDVTAFLTWFLERYPESVKIMKNNPEYQATFK